MKMYSLLRNNRQSGPFTLSEILAEGLRPQDLVWVEGRSASWRYPSELDELKAYVPAPVLEAPLDLGFTEVQNRIVQERLDAAVPITAMKVAVLPGIDTEPNDMTTFIAPPAFHGRNPSIAGNERGVPAFEALAGLLPEDELMPTMAWQEASDTVRSGRKVSILGMPVEAFPKADADQQASTGKTPKIKVLLPAAVPDKTMVVIRRRDFTGKPIEEPKVRSRRPVLEFIAEETDVEKPNPSLVADVTTSPESPVVLPSGNIVSPIPQTGKLDMPAIMQEQLVTSDADTLTAEHNSAESQPAITYPVEESPEVPRQSLDNEATMDWAYSETVTPGSWPKAQVAPTLQVNISLIQKIALITAIVSLVAVAGLIANSIFNPSAY